MAQLVLAMIAALLMGWFRSGRVVGTSKAAAEPEHPLVGDWLAVTPAGEIGSTFAADRTAVIRFPRHPGGLPGLHFVGDADGGWEATGQWAAAFVVTQPLVNDAGTPAGSATITAFVTVSKDGQRLIDSGAHGKVTIRDLAGSVTTIVHNLESIFPELAVREPLPLPLPGPAPADSSPILLGPRRWTVPVERRDRARAFRWGDNLKR